MQRDIQISLALPTLHQVGKTAKKKKQKKRVNNAHLSPRFMNLFAKFARFAVLAQTKPSSSGQRRRPHFQPTARSMGRHLSWGRRFHSSSSTSSGISGCGWFPASSSIYTHPQLTSLCVSVVDGRKCNVLASFWLCSVRSPCSSHMNASTSTSYSGRLFLLSRLSRQLTCTVVGSLLILVRDYPTYYCSLIRRPSLWTILA